MDTLSQFVNVGEVKTAPTTTGAGTPPPVADNAKPYTDAGQLWETYAERFQMLPQTTVTGFSEIDRLLKINGLATLGAGSGAGKTTFALNVLANRLRQHRPTIILTLEMSAPEIIQRLASIIYTKETGREYPANGITAQTIRNLNILALNMLYFVEYADTAGELGEFEPLRMRATVNELRRRVRESNETNGENIDPADVLIIVDSLNLITESAGNDERRAVNNAIRKLSKFAKGDGVTVLLIAQLTKETLTKGAIKETDPNDPNADFSALMYEFRESALIPYLSDSCFFLLNEKNAEPTETTANVYLCSAKNRRAPINNKVRLQFNKECFTMIEK